MTRTHSIVVVLLLSLLVIAFSVGPNDSALMATTDTTSVTLDPNMPDDFLNLYPDLTGDEIIGLPDTGVSLASVAGVGLLALGVLAVGAAVAVTLSRQRGAKSPD
jgi:hypothetical protein